MYNGRIKYNFEDETMKLKCSPRIGRLNNAIRIIRARRANKQSILYDRRALIARRPAPVGRVKFDYHSAEFSFGGNIHGSLRHIVLSGSVRDRCSAADYILVVIYPVIREPLIVKTEKLLRC